MSTNPCEVLKSKNASILNDLMNDKLVFVAPPEAPVFYPNEEEFKDPVAYIAKIRPIAEKIGICKIKPPSQWKPPFAVDVDNFIFTPRVQKLNELDAKTRIKLNFVDQIAKFWELQGTVLKLPLIEGRAIDLYTLYKNVHEEGGFVSVKKLKKWPRIAEQMGYQVKRIVTTVLEKFYERILLPFDLLKDRHNNSTLRKSNKSNKVKVRQNQARRNAFKVPKKRGRKMKNKTKKEPVNEDFDILAQYVCHICNQGDAEQSMLLCDGCDDGYHIFCLRPPLRGIPKGDWCCPKCVAEECLQPMEAFGFQQAQREYTLQQFGEMADKFKTAYFKVPCCEVTTRTVEQEYWRIISSVEEAVIVEYGADLHTMDHGSGFPTMSSKNLFSQDKEYAESPWNLNNLSELEGSVLKYINDDVSGIKVPWMYVGMCFATFCWHNEDHWTYSINYLHWGEPKTWYAVPGNYAKAFETAMQSAAPELFDSQPDLLHQLVTMINPNVLMDYGVPVFKTDQLEGEFVVTFPKAYHGGFNQGFNFAEAVNFAPADWLMVARDSILQYSKLRRLCVFSHDELICKIAFEADKLTLNIATAVYQDMFNMVKTENTLRRCLYDLGVTKGERVIFETMPDDERLCEVCKTTCFLSAISCKCPGNSFVCLRDFERLCECTSQDKILKYRYTLDELFDMLKMLKIKAEAFDEWVCKVELILNRKSPTNIYLKNLKALLNDAVDNNFPKCELLQKLSCAVKDAEKIADTIQKLKVFKYNSKYSTNNVPRITLNDLKIFKEEINGLFCILEETLFIDKLLEQGKAFEKMNAVLLAKPSHISQLEYLDQCTQYCYSMGIELPDLEKITLRQQQLQWLQQVENFKTIAHVMTIEKLKNIINEGQDLRTNNTPVIEHELSSLKELLEKALIWENKAYDLLNSHEENVLIAADQLLQQASTITCHLPTESLLYDAVEKSNDWIQRFEEIQLKKDYPFFSTLEDFIRTGKQVGLHLFQVKEMEQRLELAKSWKREAAEIFLNKNSSYTLVEALTPRTVNRAFLETLVGGALDFSSIANGMKQAEHVEIQFSKMLYRRNMDKCTNFFKSSFCLCTEEPQGTMIRCQLCRDWFHCTCLGLQQIQILQFQFTNAKYLCPNCKRTKRPNKENISNLLLNLQKLQVVIPEGEVFKCLVDRVQNWDNKAEKFIRNLQKLSPWDGNMYHLPLDGLLKEQIEEITMEGDLLEISSPNSATLYKVLRAIEKHNKIKNIINCELHRNPEEEQPIFKMVEVQSPNPNALLPYHENDIGGANGVDEIRQDWDSGVSGDSGLGNDINSPQHF